MVEHAAQSVAGIIASGSDLDRLADGNAQAARGIRVLLEYLSPHLCFGARAGRYLGSPGLHHDPAIGLLLIADLDHVDLALQPHQLASQPQCAAPLARTGFRYQALYSSLLVVVRLGDGSIQLVASGGTDALVLVEDLRRGLQRLLQAMRPDKRRGSPHLVYLLYFLGYLYIPLLTKLLLVQRRRKQKRRQYRWFLGARV